MLHKEKPDYNRNQYGFYTLMTLFQLIISFVKLMR
ncbi:transposase [Streptococcus varani]|uniref:Transposase n=1 Tax=Streptococcus varani TaxID=1608583 RepID=A0A0E4CRU1_9STRE|nr:transposase [Streptococcus varani]CQR23875.1 transposase [Streptococcus varani]CQR24340.1 transposase [Streptococcus varani]CQR25922.1 transposase [Streptococcus varani]CQR26006.1 transposase [Streptococcus varani]